jgi:hypothetical protein
MPLIINSPQGPQGIQQLNQQEQPVSNTVIVVPIDNTISDHHILVVDGKQKKVSKKSSYLLDMLVIDDE